MGSAAGSVLGSVGGIAGGVAGLLGAGSGQQSQANLDANQAVGAIQGVTTPTDLANLIRYQQYQSAGQLTPAQQQMIAASPSLQAQVKANPQLAQAQMNALNALQQQSQTGMTASTQAALNQIQQQAAAQAQGQRQAVMQNFAQRGQAGSGNELLAQLQASQNAANQANQSGLGVAANAQQNALSALGQYGQQAGAMNTQQYGQQAQAAAAADALNRFNVQNQLGLQAQNVNAQNQAQAANLQNAQQLSNQNTAMSNQALNQQRAGEQQQFADAMQKAGALSGAYSNQADYYSNLANQTQQMWGNIAGGGGKMLGSAFGGSGSPGGGGGGGGGGGSVDTSGGAIGSSGDTLSFKAHGGEIDQPYSFGGHVPKEEDQYVRTYGNGYDAPNNYADGGPVADPLLEQYMRSGKDAQHNMMTGGIVPGYADGGMIDDLKSWYHDQAVKGNLGSGVQAGAMADDRLVTGPSLSGQAYPSQPKNYDPNAQTNYFVGGNVTGNQKPEDYNPLLGPAQQHQDTDMDNPIMKMLPMITSLAASGGRVPGKAKVRGDSYKNDTVPARLSPKEIVIPRSITLSDSAPEKAKQFVKKIKDKEE